MWSRRETGKAAWETRRPFSVRVVRASGRYAADIFRCFYLAAARPIASLRRCRLGAIFSLNIATSCGGALSGEPELNGGAGLYSRRRWVAAPGLWAGMV